MFWADLVELSESRGKFEYFVKIFEAFLIH